MKPLADRIIRTRSSSTAPLDPWITLIERILIESDASGEHETKLKQDLIAIKRLHGTSFVKLYKLFADDALNTLQEHDGKFSLVLFLHIQKIFYCNEWPKDFHVPYNSYLPIPQQFSNIDVPQDKNLIVVKTFVKSGEITEFEEGYDTEDSPQIEIKDNNESAYLLGNWIFNARSN